jgi:hypothetical protein
LYYATSEAASLESAPQIDRVYNGQATDHVASRPVWHSHMKSGKQAVRMAKTAGECDVSRMKGLFMRVAELEPMCPLIDDRDTSAHPYTTLPTNMEA